VAWLNQSLNSIRQQTVPVHIRVVAPSGTDLSATCDTYGAELITFDEPGLSRAINHGMRPASVCADFDYVTWLGDDDLLSTDSLRMTRRALRATPNAPFGYGWCRYLDGDDQVMFMFRPGPWGAWWSRYGSDLVPQLGSLIRAQAWRAVGGLNEDLKHAMDLDLFLRLTRLGRPAYLPVELGSWRVHPASISSGKPNGAESAWARQTNAQRRADRAYPVLSSVVNAGPNRLLTAAMRRLPEPRRTRQVRYWA
jgi:GT2 family glycosyltransferase